MQIKQPFVMRGEQMNRIETFVAAAFAFALTMLVISVGSMPSNIDEFVLAIKNVPGFVASSGLIMWVWYSHANWCRHYGLEDVPTALLSGVMICIVLVYMYPLRIMTQGFFMSISGGYFPVELELDSINDLRILFIFYAVGFALLSMTFCGLFWHALRLKTELALNADEVFHTRMHIWHWAATSAVCIVVVLVTALVSQDYLLLTPYIFALLFPLHMGLSKYLKADSTASAQQEQ